MPSEGLLQRCLFSSNGAQLEAALLVLSLFRWLVFSKCAELQVWNYFSTSVVGVDVHCKLCRTR